MTVPAILVVAPPRAGTPAGAMAEKFGGARERAEGIGAAFAAIAAELGCAFFDAGRIITASPVDGVHLDADQHVILARELAGPVGKLL